MQNTNSKLNIFVSTKNETIPGTELCSEGMNILLYTSLLYITVHKNTSSSSVCCGYNIFTSQTQEARVCVCV